jgi:flagellar biosynthesis/type III secretory pathway protein FliH
MTGFDSKRDMAQYKMNDDAQSYIAQYEQALLITYQQGFADGKRAAQRKPLTDEEIWQIATNCTIGGDLHADKFARAIEAAHNIKEGT